MRLRRTTLSEDAYDAVRGILLDASRFSPGDKISVEALARELGVSRSPVWSAISRLEAEGLVDIAPRKGGLSGRLRAGEIARLVRGARSAPKAWRPGSPPQRITPAELAAAAAQVARQRVALKRKAVAAYSAATLAFHDAVTEAARNLVIARQLAAIYSQVHAICGGERAKIGWPGRRLHIEDHAALVEALRRRDADGAERMAGRMRGVWPTAC
ncbi:MAG: GntR family transcriptional regulator [Pseudomonadota bacterium]